MVLLLGSIIPGCGAVDSPPTEGPPGAQTEGTMVRVLADTLRLTVDSTNEWYGTLRYRIHNPRKDTLYIWPYGVRLDYLVDGTTSYWYTTYPGPVLPAGLPPFPLAPQEAVELLYVINVIDREGFYPRFAAGGPREGVHTLFQPLFRQVMTINGRLVPVESIGDSSRSNRIVVVIEGP